MNLRPQRREQATIELTPLIDVVFLLLIFFLLTSSISQAQQNQSRDSLLPLPVATGAAMVGQKRESFSSGGRQFNSALHGEALQCSAVSGGTRSAYEILPLESARTTLMCSRNTHRPAYLSSL